MVFSNRVYENDNWLSEDSGEATWLYLRLTETFMYYFVNI